MDMTVTTDKDKKAHVYEIVWVKDGLMNCKQLTVDGHYEPCCMPQEVKEIVDVLYEKGYPYYVYFIGNIMRTKGGYTIPEAHCAWFNPSGVGDCKL